MVRDELSVLAAFANIWYVRHVLSLLWHLIRPWALALIGTNVLRVILGAIGRGVLGNDPPEIGPLALISRGLSYGSLVPAPGVSFVDALIYLCVSYYASRRTRLIRTGMLAAGGTSFVGFTVLFTALAISTPNLLLAPFSNPFIFVILATLLLIAVGYGVLVGAAGAVVGIWSTPEVLREGRIS